MLGARGSASGGTTGHGLWSPLVNTEIKLRNNKSHIASLPCLPVCDGIGAFDGDVRGSLVHALLDFVKPLAALTAKVIVRGQRLIIFIGLVALPGFAPVSFIFHAAPVVISIVHWSFPNRFKNDVVCFFKATKKRVSCFH